MPDRWISKDFDIEKISNRWYKVTPTERDDKTIAMTGSNVTKSFDLPFTCVFARVHLYHMDSSYDAGTGAISIILRRPQVHGFRTFIDDFFAREDLIKSKVIISLEDLNPEGGIVFEPSSFDIILDSTSTDLIGVIIYVKRLD